MAGLKPDFFGEKDFARMKRVRCAFNNACGHCHQMRLPWPPPWCPATLRRRAAIDRFPPFTSPKPTNTKPFENELRGLV
jgi:hypothetical protein